MVSFLKEISKIVILSFLLDNLLLQVYEIFWNKIKVQLTFLVANWSRAETKQRETEGPCIKVTLNNSNYISKCDNLI